MRDWSLLQDGECESKPLSDRRSVRQDTTLEYFDFLLCGHPFFSPVEYLPVAGGTKLCRSKINTHCTLPPTLILKVAMLPVVIVGESAGIASIVCGGRDDMLRLKLGVDAPTGSTLDRLPFFICHLVPKTGTLLMKEQAICSMRAKEGAGARMTLPYQGPACCDAKTAWRATCCSCLLQGGAQLVQFSGSAGPKPPASCCGPARAQLRTAGSDAQGRSRDAAPRSPRVSPRLSSGASDLCRAVRRSPVVYVRVRPLRARRTPASDASRARRPRALAPRSAIDDMRATHVAERLLFGGRNAKCTKPAQSLDKTHI
jgi:hypothetical protein